MGGGPPSTNVKVIPGKKEALSDGSGGVLVSCPEKGTLPTRKYLASALGHEGELYSSGGAVELVIGDVVVAIAAGSAARTLLRCIDAEFKYRGKTEAVDGRTFIRFWMA